MYKRRNIMKTNRNYLRTMIGFWLATVATLLLSVMPGFAQITVYGNSFVVAPGGEVNSFGGITIADSGSIDNSGTIRAGGDWTNNGNGLINSSPGTIEFNGTTPQTIAGNQITTFSNLTINNDSGVIVNNNVIVDQKLYFKLGAIILESAYLELSSPSTQVVGADSTRYIKTLSTGVVDRVINGLAADTGKPMIFPVGRLQYAPVTLTFHGTSNIPSNMTFRVGNSVDAPPGGVDQNNRSNVIWEQGGETQGILPPFEATFDITSTVNTGNIQKYVVMKWDKDSLWSRPTPQLMPRPPNYAINLNATTGSFIIGEPIRSGVNTYPDIIKDFLVINNIAPNPGSCTMNFTYTLGSGEDTRLELFNTLGQSVGLLSDSFQTQGQHQGSFNVGALSEGTYFLRLTTRFGKASAVVKVIH
jgi:hypothetical protein